MEIDKITLLKQWILKQRNGTISSDEQRQLEEWLLGHPSYQRLIKRITNEELLLEDVLDWIRLKDSDQDDWILRLEKATVDLDQQKGKSNHFIRFRKLAGIAAILFLLAGASLFAFHQFFRDSNPLVTEDLSVEQILPASNQARLVLAEGEVELELDQGAEGVIFGERIVYEDGTEVFDARLTDDSLTWVTLEVPRGGKYKVQLFDGTEVWLNAESKLRYPLRFSNFNRKVELDGEAYFKVRPMAFPGDAHDPTTAFERRVPFHIVANDQLIEVLGTELNVKAYHEDATTRTTLVTGSVVVSQGSQSYRLTPGEKVESTQYTFTKSTSNIDEDIAWKNNKFVFNETELRHALTEISRWYNFQVEYKGVVHNTHFYGEISRDKDLAQILTIFKDIGLNFKLKQVNGVNTLIVLP